VDRTVEISVAMDPERIAGLGVLSLPQLVIDGQLTPSSIWSSTEKLEEIMRTASRQG